MPALFIFIFIYFLVDCRQHVDFLFVVYNAVCHGGLSASG